MLDMIRNVFGNGYGKFEPELWRKASEKRMQFTPDLLKLSEKRKHFLFVYDEMKVSFPNHKMIPGAEFVCNGTTILDTFEVYRRRTEVINSVIAVKAPAPDPLCMRFDPRKPGPGRIRGQILLVPTETLFELDEKMANGLYSERQKLKVRLPWSGKTYKKVQRQWMVSDEEQYLPTYSYLGNKDLFDLEQSIPLKPVSRFVPRTRENNGHSVQNIPYYEFTRYDLNGS